MTNSEKLSNADKTASVMPFLKNTSWSLKRSENHKHNMLVIKNSLDV